MMLKQNKLFLMKKLGHAREKWVLLYKWGVLFLSSGHKKLQDSVPSLISYVRRIYIFMSIVFFHWDLSSNSSAICCPLFEFYTILYLWLEVQRYDPTYEATKLHFEDLAKRYGNPIIVLNLIKVCITFLCLVSSIWWYRFPLFVLTIFGKLKARFMLCSSII